MHPNDARRIQSDFYITRNLSMVTLIISCVNMLLLIYADSFVHAIRQVLGG